MLLLGINKFPCIECVVFCFNVAVETDEDSVRSVVTVDMTGNAVCVGCGFGANGALRTGGHRSLAFHE